MNWVVVVPVWGEYHTNIFTLYALPALRLAIATAGINPQLIIHTDEPDTLKPALEGLQVRFADTSWRYTPHEMLSYCHRDAMSMVQPGDAVMFLNADMITSREVFTACAARFWAGKRLIITAATRCMPPPMHTTPPIGASARALLAWSLEAAHPSVRDCFWHTGRSTVPWALYFKGSHGVVLRGFHLHPIAFVMAEQLTFEGASIDVDLVDSFNETDIYVVTQPDEMAIAELSPLEYRFPSLVFPMDVDSVTVWAKNNTTPRHRWLFSHRIVLSGVGEDYGDLDPCDEILQRLAA